MIDIFGLNGPFINVAELVSGCFQEFGVFFLNFIILFSILILVKRLTKKRIAPVAALLMPILQITYVWNVSIRSEFFFSAAFAFLLVIQLWILHLFPLHPEEYLFFFSVLLFPNRLFNSASAVLGDLWLFWVIFCVCYTTAKVGLCKLRGNQFGGYFLFVMLSLSAYAFHLAVLFLHSHFSDWMGSYAAGLFCTVVLLLTLLIGTALFFRVKFYQQLLKLNQLGQKYEGIERYFFYFSILILTLCTLIFLPFTILNSQNSLVLLLFPGLCLTLLLAQMPFILLLYRVAFYKDSATFSQWEKEGVLSYYQGLTESLTSIEEMRHDIKNIFFTMGNFMNRSNDQEMKDFFWEKIYPYSENAIQQSELLSSIYQLPAEPLRAFFHLKLSQTIRQKVSIHLKVDIDPETFKAGMDIIDLTRILGILLDNAIEEAVHIHDGTIDIRISGNGTGSSYIIKNSITEQTQIRGIHTGETTKGPSHGKGLLIVQQLLEQYNHVVMNSFIQNQMFIQSLNIDTKSDNS